MKYIKVGCVEISPSSRVENLRVWFDSSVNMCSHKLCASAFFSVYLQHKAYQEVPIQGDSAETLLHAFISSSLGCGNSLLLCLLQYQIQRVQNASARLIFSMPRYCHITPLLFDLHWLPVNQRIVFKIVLLVYKVSLH